MVDTRNASHLQKGTEPVHRNLSHIKFEVQCARLLLWAPVPQPEVINRKLPLQPKAAKLQANTTNHHSKAHETQSGP